jgi:hypothetical protein
MHIFNSLTVTVFYFSPLEIAVITWLIKLYKYVNLHNFSIFIVILTQLHYYFLEFGRNVNNSMDCTSKSSQVQYHYLM